MTGLMLATLYVSARFALAEAKLLPPPAGIEALGLMLMGVGMWIIDMARKHR